MNAPNSPLPDKAVPKAGATGASAATDEEVAPPLKDFREDAKVREQVGELGRSAARGATPEALAAVRKAEPKNDLLPRIKMFSDMPDKGLFVVSIACGFVLIFGLKTYGGHLGLKGDFTALVTVATALLMIAYGVLAYRMPAVRLRADRLGDNFYYMGFIFTLASMSAALVQMRTSDDVTNLIGSFGIALVSTILGIAGRVAFVQMRTEVEDVEERVRQSLLEAADLLRGQLGAASRDLETFRLGVQQAVHERLNESVAAFGSATAELQQRQGESFIALHERLKQSAVAYTDATVEQVASVKRAVEQTILSAQTAFAGHEEAAARLVKLGASVTQSADRLAARLEAVNVPPEILERKIGAVVDRIDGVAASFEAAAVGERARYLELSEAAANLRRIVSQVGTQLRKLEETTRSMDSSMEPATQMAARLSRINTALEGAATSASNLAHAITATKGASEIVANSAAAYSDALAKASRTHTDATLAAVRDAESARIAAQQDLAASRAAVGEVQRALADTVRAVTSTIDVAKA